MLFFFFFISKDKYINKSTRGTGLHRSKSHQSPGSQIRLYAVSIGTRDWIRIHFFFLEGEDNILYMKPSTRGTT